MQRLRSPLFSHPDVSALAPLPLSFRGDHEAPFFPVILKRAIGDAEGSRKRLRTKRNFSIRMRRRERHHRIGRRRHANAEATRDR